MPPPETVAVLTLVAFVAATISGLIGMAGGILLLAAMLVADIPLAVAVPAHALVQLVSNGTRVMALLNHVRWRPLLIFAAASMPFPLLGLLLADALSPEVLKPAIGGVVLYAVWGPKGDPARLRERPAMLTAGTLTGTLGVVVGATGPLIAPFFLREDWSKEEVVATKATCQSWTHLQKTAAFGLLAPRLFEAQLLERGELAAFDPVAHAGLVVPLAAAVVGGTLVGTRLLRRVSERGWRFAFRLTLTLIALRLLAGPLLQHGLPGAG